MTLTPAQRAALREAAETPEQKSRLRQFAAKIIYEMGSNVTLRERCKLFYQTMQRNAMLRQGDPVEDLTAFVVAETGRKADTALESTLPLCLYFGSAEDREEFIAMVREVKPNMMMKKMP